MNDETTTEPALTARQLRMATARRWAPFLAFVGGFIFDSITLGIEVNELDLYLVSFYSLTALLLMLTRTRDLGPRVNRYTGWGLQFCLGGSLSAVVVLYFRSTGQLYSYFFVGLLFLAMVMNELAHREEPQRDLIWAMWGVSGAMLANFVIPHLVGTVSWIYFYACIAASFGIIVVLRTLARASWRSVRMPAVAIAVLALAWVLGFVPPVPLVMRNTLVCTNYEKGGGEYACDVDAQGLLQRVGILPRVVTRQGGEGVYYLTAVFAPRRVDATLKHYWYRETADGWEQTDDMTFDITGGRKDGWRFWSRKRSTKPGLWKVETALDGGAVLGYEIFRVEDGSGAKRRENL